jgi:pimeloyl-ACP methyl ester carboxylesterase
MPGPDEVRRWVTGAAGVELAARQTGPPDGRPIVLLHGLTMSRDSVLMGSTELESGGFRVVAYDARGHGESAPPADPADYGYDALLADLRAVMAAFDVGRAVLVGNSMGSHTSLRLALEEPERVAGLAVITPAYDSDRHPIPENLREARALADGIRERGAEGFAQAVRMPPGIAEKTARTLTRRRLSHHRSLLTLADALEANLRAAPFESLAELAAIRVPTLVVGSRDDFDPRHPLYLAEKYAAALPGSRFAVEDAGRAPLAWNGRKLARLVLELAEQAAWDAPSALRSAAGAAR